MARRLNLSRSSNDDGVAVQMGRAIVLPRGLVENTVTFDRPSQWNSLVRPRDGNYCTDGKWPTTWPQASTAQAVPCARARLRATRTSCLDVWTVDETTGLTKCALSLPRKIYMVWMGEMWQYAYALSRWQSTPSKTCLDAASQSL
jgi:hypothetical protein